jgi:hypothetical protein
VFKGKTWSIDADNSARLEKLVDEQLVVAGARLAAFLNAVSE